jgi:hypothetical protein
MPGPLPQPQTRRRNSQEFDELPVEGFTGKFPKLPAAYKRETWDPAAGKHRTTTVKFLASTKKKYEAWARSPIAVEFMSIHWDRLHDLMVLQDRFDRGDHSVSSELRQGKAGFGGDPSSLHRLRKRVGAPRSAEQGPAGGGERRATSARRARLSVVK